MLALTPPHISAGGVRPARRHEGAGGATQPHPAAELLAGGCDRIHGRLWRAFAYRLCLLWHLEGEQAAVDCNGSEAGWVGGWRTCLLAAGGTAAALQPFACSCAPCSTRPICHRRWELAVSSGYCCLQQLSPGCQACTSAAFAHLHLAHAAPRPAPPPLLRPRPCRQVPWLPAAQHLSG